MNKGFIKNSESFVFNDLEWSDHEIEMVKNSAERFCSAINGEMELIEGVSYMTPSGKLAYNEPESWPRYVVYWEEEVSKEEMIEVKKTGREYDFIATVENKTDATITINFDDSDYDIHPIELKPHDWCGLLADDDGRLMLEYLENGRYDIDDNGYYLRKILIETAENLDWNVHEDENGGIDFRKYSPAGEDFGVYVHPDQDIVEEIRDFYLNFDQDEHIAMWLEAKDNKVAGVPSARELVEDAAAIEKMLEELADAFVEVAYGPKKTIREIVSSPNENSTEDNQLKNVEKYCADFNSHAPAEDTKPTKVVIVVEGGMVSSVYSSDPSVEVEIEDLDSDWEDIEPSDKEGLYCITE